MHGDTKCLMMSQMNSNIVTMIKDLLLEKKAFDIKDIDVRSKNYISDYVIVASGTSFRHLQTMAEHIVKALKEHGLYAKVEGESSNDWILIDAFDVIVHLFKPETREFYNIEDLWIE